MIIMIFAAIIGVFSINLTSLSLSYTGLNRAIIYAPIEIMYNSILIENDGAYFHTGKLIQIMDEYYASTLPKYCDSYTTRYYFFNEDELGICLNKSCLAFNVSISAKVRLNQDYNKTMTYRIGGPNNG